MESKTVHERLIKTVTSALNAAGVYFAQLFSGCSLGAKASALGAEDRGFKSLHPEILFLAIYRLIKLLLVVDF